MSDPKVSREEAERFVRALDDLVDGGRLYSDRLAYLRAVCAALEPEPSAVRLTEQEERLGYMMPKFKASAVEELLRAASDLAAHHSFFCKARGGCDETVMLDRAIAAVRRERGEEGR